MWPNGCNPTRPYTLQSLRHGSRRATRLRVGPLCRCATSPHTVGSHPLHKGGFVLAQPYWLIAYKKMDVGGGVPDAPGNFALLPNVRFIVGADSISARATLCNHPIARRGQDPSLQTNHKLSSNPQNRNHAYPHGASGTPPPTFNHASGVGANIVRPCSWVATLDSAGGCKHPPLRNPKVTFRPRRGQSFSLAGFLGAIAPEP